MGVAAKIGSAECYGNNIWILYFKRAVRRTIYRVLTQDLSTVNVHVMSMMTNKKDSVEIDGGRKKKKPITLNWARGFPVHESVSGTRPRCTCSLCVTQTRAHARTHAHTATHLCDTLFIYLFFINRHRLKPVDSQLWKQAETKTQMV